MIFGGYMDDFLHILDKIRNAGNQKVPTRIHF